MKESADVVSRDANCFSVCRKALELLEQPPIAVIPAIDTMPKKQKALARAKALSKTRSFAVIVWSSVLPACWLCCLRA